MAQTPKYYHHGRSPAAWAGSVTAAVGFVLATVGVFLGLNWPIIIAGGALVLFAGIMTMVLKTMGYGQP